MSEDTAKEGQGASAEGWEISAAIGQAPSCVMRHMTSFKNYPCFLARTPPLSQIVVFLFFR